MSAKKDAGSIWILRHSNQAAAEWIQGGGLFPEEVSVYRERKYGNSRFDIYVESPERKAFIEVKGVTLEENNIVRFPDAPTERGLKHVEELAECMQDGYEAYLLFVIQMKDVRKFQPNWNTHHRFGDALKAAREAGVRILASGLYDRRGFYEEYRTL